MAIVTSYDWESDTYQNHMPVYGTNDTMEAHQKWLDCVHAAVERARTAMPTHEARITRAHALVLDGMVTPQPDGTFQVRSQNQRSTKTYTVNGRCECPDSSKVSDNLCKHLLATLIWRRAKSLMKEPAETSTPAAQEPTAVEEKLTLDLDTQVASVPLQHVVMIQGKAFVRYVGLLQLAQERGLIALTADWTYNDAELSLAHAVAVFSDGRRFEESGDASPQNTNRKVAVHFRRVALTRAKARVLRDALGIDLVAVEELSDSE
jgi:hypothetical protein